ncbi:hypothetical protein AFEL58S_03469 [Afipia felis]
MRHRVKNLFAMAGAIVSISATSSGRGSDLIDDIRARLSSLARAHEMTMADRLHNSAHQPALSLLTLIGRILTPCEADGRVMIGGTDCTIGGRAIPYLSLLLHELAANAAKFGALSAGSGRLTVSIAADDSVVSPGLVRNRRADAVSRQVGRIRQPAGAKHDGCSERHDRARLATDGSGGLDCHAQDAPGDMTTTLGMP